MATVNTSVGAHPSPHPAKDEHRDLSYSMNRVLAELVNLHDGVRDSHPASRKSSDTHDAVHGLRVSIRRCRSIGGLMEEVDPDPAWPAMRHAAKKLFRGLGALRDAQVLQSWIAKLAPAEDPIATQLRSEFSAGEPQLLQDAIRAARKFDEKNWKHLERNLRRRSRFVPPGSLAAECLALERFNAAKELHARALRSEKSKPWHALRGYMKRFRYTVENLLPVHHASWRENLKRVQDLLGDIHDLDVLSEAVKSAAIPGAEASRRAWREILAAQRAERIAAYRQLMVGSTSLWNAWRHALPHGRRLEAAAMARLRATARAADAHPRRTARTSRLAKSLFDSLRRAKAAAVFADPLARRLLDAAANLQNARAQQQRKAPQPKSPQKAAHKFLQALPMPPGFLSEDWSVLLAAVRYHRGAEPREKNSIFAKLSAAQQNEVRALAGVLRLARALRRSGVDTASRFRAEVTPEAILLRIPGLPDTLETAARLAAAKHLLEVCLAKPLILRPAPKPAEVLTPAAAPEVELQHFAAASD
jgi:CHAD domain-containing protein